MYTAAMQQLDSSIHVTPAAKEALDSMRARHGDLILHIPGGCCDGRMPLCLKADELRLGAWDILLGEADGVPVYKTQSTPERYHARDDYMLDVVPGTPVGFSLDLHNGMKLILLEAAGSRT